MYALYRKSKGAGRASFEFIKKCSLFGCRQGLIPRLLGKRIPEGQNEPFTWHVPIEDALNETNECPESTLIIDLKPKQHKTNLSLYELIDVWGFSSHGWTPILLHLSGLFVDVDPKTVDRNAFAIENCERSGPIYEVLYLTGGIRNGSIEGKWVPPPASPTNAALLWPETLRFFVESIRQRTPDVLSD